MTRTPVVAPEQLEQALDALEGAIRELRNLLKG